jgi:hypothetical protein
MKSHCSPNNQEIYDQTHTCYTLQQLRTIAKQYNVVYKTKTKIKVYTSKKELLASLRKHLSVHEAKWYTLDFMKDLTDVKKNTFHESFRPTSPEKWWDNSKMLLNTDDIMNVMSQYEKKYHSFKFLGVHPLDFSSKLDQTRCISPIMCHFDVRTLLGNGTTQCGVILNLDYHNQPGSHWVSMYIGLSPNLPNFGCFYIDSTATKAPLEVVNFMHRVKQQIIKKYVPKQAALFKLKQNKKQFQFENTECGMFSMYFLMEFLEKKTFKTIINSNINDTKVNNLRKEYYNPILK